MLFQLGVEGRSAGVGALKQGKENSWNCSGINRKTITDGQEEELWEMHLEISDKSSADFIIYQGACDRKLYLHLKVGFRYSAYSNLKAKVDMCPK